MSERVRLDRSPIWERIHAGPLAEAAKIDLDTFRSSSPLYSISLWDPQRSGLRYLKTLLQVLLANGASDADLYRRIPRRDVGRPITVRFHGVDVCLDYFQAVDEAKTIASAGLPMSSARIVEIGPGYGRTCHTLLSLHPEISEYWLVDLDPCLVLARRYLARVLDEAAFAKVRFLTVQAFEGAVSGCRFRLAINIDSFGDLPPEIVTAYLALIDRSCDAFYCKNPVAKYLDPALGGEAVTNERVQLALKSGLLREVIDIFDDGEVMRAVPKFLAAYRPSDAWEIAVDRWAPPWSYYHQALYRRGPS